MSFGQNNFSNSRTTINNGKPIIQTLDTKYDPTRLNINMNTSNKSISGQIMNNNINTSNRIIPKPISELEKIERITDKIYIHFQSKYPSTIEAAGLKKETIKLIIESITKKNPLNEKNISKIIDVIDMKFKTTIHSENREGIPFDLNQFSMDDKTKISFDKYLENYTNKVSELVNSDKSVEANLPKNMSVANDMVVIKEPEPFNEDFPLRDRESGKDMLIPEVREFDYYFSIDSKDRDPEKYPDPNNFVIDFSPANDGKLGYIDRGFGNIKSCELVNITLMDTSNTAGSSDYGGISYPYLLLQCEELQQNFFGTNNNISRSFAILTTYTQQGKYKYYNIAGDSSDYSVIKIYNPRINLNKLTTKICLPDGTPFNFGDAFTNDTSNTVVHMSFRITTIQKNLATKFLDKATY